MVKEVIMYTVICDNCRKDSNAGQEFSCWNDKDFAEDSADELGWLKEGGKHYCDDCFSYDDDDNMILKEIKHAE